MVFECLNYPLCCIMPVNMWWDKLEFLVMFWHEVLQGIGEPVVKDVKPRFEFFFGEILEGCHIVLRQLLAFAGFEMFSHDKVIVLMVCDQEVIVLATWCDKEAANLICVNFSSALNVRELEKKYHWWGYSLWRRELIIIYGDDRLDYPGFLIGFMKVSYNSDLYFWTVFGDFGGG